MTPIIFVIISVLSLLLFYFGTGSNKRLLLVFLAWQLIVVSLSVGKVFEENPNLFSLAIFCTVAITLLTLKRIDRQKINTKILLGIHLLRIPVEFVLYQLYLENKIPGLMTFKGWNFDILIGFSALALLAYTLSTNRKMNRLFFFIWNVIGIVFLLFIVSLAILSSPLPIQQFAYEQPNIAVLEFPYCLLPTCVVPTVLISHLLLLQYALTEE